MCRSTGQDVYGGIGGRGQNPICFGDYNIQNGRNGGLELVLRRMGQINMDVGVFQEIKLTDRIYTQGLDG